MLNNKEMFIDTAMKLLAENKFAELKLSKLKKRGEWQQPALKTLAGYSSEVYSLVVLPNGQLASASIDKTIKLWNLETGTCVKTLAGHSHCVWSLAVLPNGQLASGSYDNTIKLWNLETGACVKTLAGGHSSRVHSLEVLPNGQLASGSADSTIKIWNVETGACVKTLAGYSSEVYSLAVLPNGQLASASHDTTIKLWNVETGTCIKTLAGHSSCVRRLKVLPNGQLASGSYDKTIKLWNVETGACVKTLAGHGGCVWSLAVLPNCQLVSASDDSTIKLWNVETGACIKTLAGHSSRVWSLAVLPNGQLASGSNDKTIKLWACESLAATLADQKPVLQALKTNRSVIKLDLSQIHLDQESFGIIAEIFKTNPILTTINLANTGLSTETAKLLLTALKQNSHSKLIDLNLEGNELSRAIIMQLRNQLRHNAAGANFNLRGEHTTSSGAKPIPREKTKISEDFCCSISHLIMLDPVMAADGETYEREEIEQWLKQHKTSPVRNIILDNKHLMPNRALKRTIDTFLNDHPDLWLGDEIYVSKKLIQRLIEAINIKDRNKIDRIVATDKRLLTRELINNQNLLALVCGSNVEILNFVLTKLGDQFWELPEIENHDGVNLFRSAAVSLGLSGAQLIAKTLGWEQKEFQEQLEAAVTSGNSILAQICLQLGAKLEQKDKDGQTPLHCAINLGHYGLVNVLLQCGANPNLKDQQGNTVLHLAVINGNEKFIDLLFNLANIRLTSTTQPSSSVPFSSVIDNQQLLSAEVKDKHYSFMEHPIFSSGAAGDCGFTALGIDRDTAVQLLLDNIENEAIRHTVALEIIEASREGTLPETITQKSEYQQVMKAFQQAQQTTDEAMRQLRKQYNLKGTHEELLMSFQDSKKTKGQEIYERLLAIKQDLTKAEQRLKEYFQTEDNIYKAFVGSYHSSKGNKWLTVLAHNRGGIVDALATLRHINVCFWNKKSGGALEPLHCYGNMNSATHILHTGQGTHFNFLELMALNEKEQPIQIISAAAKKAQTLPDSAKCQLDLNLANTQQETPLQIALNSYAKNLNYYSIIEKLIKAGAKLNIANKDGDTPLFQAIKLKDFKLFTLLLTENTNIEVVDQKGNTALHLAAKSGAEKVAMFLLEHGANGKALNKQQQTPAVAAREAGHYQLAIRIERKRQELKILPFLKPLQEQLQIIKQHIIKTQPPVHRKQAVKRSTENMKPGKLKTPFKIYASQLPTLFKKPEGKSDSKPQSEQYQKSTTPSIN